MKVLCLSLMAGDNGFTKAFRKKCSEYHELHPGTSGFNSKSVSMAKKIKPDFIFIQIQTANVISKDAVKMMKRTGAFIVNWTGDVRYPIPKWYYDIGQHIDSTVFTNMTDVEKMICDGLESNYVEIGIDPDIYTPNGQSTISNDIVFFGNNYGDGYFPLSGFRIEMVNRLKSRFNNFSVYGSGWPFGDGSMNHSQHEEAAAYRGAKIAINVSHFDYSSYSSDRLLRILGSGAFCLCKRFPNMEYNDGEHLVVWETLDELEEKINYYLENEEERNEIAKNGCYYVHENHTFENMVDNLLKLKT